MKMLQLVTILLGIATLGDAYTYHQCQEKYTYYRERLMTLRSSCPAPVFHSCCNLKNTFYFAQSGVYELNHPCSGDNDAGQSKVFAYCDMETDDGGWIVIQRRTDGSLPFNRTFEEYENGFGDPSGEFWYGLRNIYCLTTTGHTEVRIDFKYENGTSGYAHFSNFYISPKESYYISSLPAVILSSPGARTFRNPSSNGRFYVQSLPGVTWYRQTTYNIGGWWDSSVRGNPNGPGSSGNETAYAQWNGVFTPQIEVKIRPKTCPLAALHQCLPYKGHL
jgi:hypothetical protein